MIKAKVFICEDCLFHNDCAENSGVNSITLLTKEYGQIVACARCPWQGAKRYNGQRAIEPCEVTIDQGNQKITDIYKLLKYKNITNKCQIAVEFTKEERNRMVRNLAAEMFRHVMNGTSPSTYYDFESMC